MITAQKALPYWQKKGKMPSRMQTGFHEEHTIFAALLQTTKKYFFFFMVCDLLIQTHKYITYDKDISNKPHLHFHNGQTEEE